MNCTSGCPTKDHDSYGACLRAKGVRVAWADSANNRDYATEKRFAKTNEAYREARAAGLQPKGVDMTSIRRATEDAANAEKNITVSLDASGAVADIKGK